MEKSLTPDRPAVRNYAQTRKHEDRRGRAGAGSRKRAGDRANTNDKPKDLDPVVRHHRAEPKGVTLAKELNLDTPVKDKNPLFVDPTQTADAKKPDPKVIRTPKDEELIFDKRT